MLPESPTDRSHGTSRPTAPAASEQVKIDLDRRSHHVRSTQEQRQASDSLNVESIVIKSTANHDDSWERSTALYDAAALLIDHTPKEAVSAYTQAIELTPNFAHAFLARGAVNSRIGDFEAAISDYERATELNPMCTLLASSSCGANVISGTSRKYETILDYAEPPELDPFEFNIPCYIDSSPEFMLSRPLCFKSLFENFYLYTTAFYTKNAPSSAMAGFNEALADHGKDTQSTYLAAIHYTKGISKLTQAKYHDALAEFRLAVKQDRGFWIAISAREFVKNNIERISDKSSDHLLSEIFCNLNYGYSYREIDYEPVFSPADIIEKSKISGDEIKIDIDQGNNDYGDFQTSLTVNSLSAYYHFQNGIIAGNLGLQYDAIRDYSNAIALDQKFASAYCNRGIAKCALGHYKDAILDYSKAIALDPEFAPSYCNRGIAKSILGDNTAAISDYSRALELDDRFAIAYYHRGMVNGSDEKNLASAVDDLVKAIDLAPGLILAHFRLAMIRRKLGQYEAAIDDFTKAIDLDPSNIEAIYYRGVTRAVLDQHNGALDDYSEALFHLTPPLDSADTVANIYCNRSFQFGRMGLHGSAIDDCSKAIKLDSRSTIGYYNRAIGSGNMGKEKAAIDDLSTAIRIDPDFISAYFARGVFKNRQNMYQEAIGDFTRVIQLDDSFTSAYVLRGIINSKLNRFEEAIDDFRKALESESSTRVIHYNRGIAMSKSGEYNRALWRDYERRDYDRHVSGEYEYQLMYSRHFENDDRHIGRSTFLNEVDEHAKRLMRDFDNEAVLRGICGRGVAIGKLGQHEEAVDTFAWLIEQDVYFTSAYYNRGVARGMLGQYKEALDDLSMAIKLDQRYAMAYCNRGVVQHRLGKHSEAIDDLNKAVQLRGGSSEFHYNRAVIMSDLGMFGKAIRDFSKALELDIFAVGHCLRRGVRTQAEKGHKRGSEDCLLDSLALRYLKQHSDQGTLFAVLGEDIMDSNSEVCEFVPDFVKAYFNRGVVRLMSGNYRDSIRDFDTVIELNPNFDRAFYRRGIAKGNMGWYEGAIEDFSEAIALNPKYVKAVRLREIAIDNLTKRQGRQDAY